MSKVFFQWSCVLRFALIGAMWVISPAFAQQQPEGYWLQHFTDENGLPQNSVKAIAQDRNGFVWLTTEAGVVRFDGHRFVTFEKSVLPIMSNRFRGFVPFIGTGQSTAPDFFALSEKSEYVGIMRNGLVSVDTTFYRHYKKYDPIASRQPRHNRLLASLPSQHVVDPNFEHYFITTDNGITYLWQKSRITGFQNGKPFFTARGSFQKFLLAGRDPYAVDASGTLRSIGTSVTDAVIGGEILADKRFSNGPRNLNLFWNNISRQLFLYFNQSLYLARSISAGKLETRLILRNFDLEKSKIVSVLFDENTQSVFLGSISSGLFLFKKKEFEANRLTAENADNVYYGQLAVAGRAVLTAQGYYFKADSGSSTASVVRISPLLEKIKSTFSLAQSPDGSLWAQFGFDLYQMDSMGLSILQYIRLPEKAKTLNMGPDGTLWISCQTNGIFSVEKVDGRFITRRRYKLDVADLSIVGRENQETLFLATERAVYRLNTRTGSFRKIDRLDKMTVRSTYTTRDGTWITTYGNGIFFLKDEQVVQFPLDDDRCLATSHCIVEDQKGFFWITTNRGLFQVAKKHLLDYVADRRNLVYYLFYNKSNGFATNEFNGGCQPCSVTLTDGTVSFPSMDGLIWFKPENIRPELPDRKIFITAIQQDGKAIPVADTLALSRDFEQLKFTLTTPYLGNERNIRMHYSLSGPGRDESWTAIGSDFVISVPHLLHGDYVLKIRKVIGFATNDYVYKTVYLRVPRAWYETWWFRVAAALVLGTLFVVSVRLRSAYHIKKEREAGLLRHYRVISQIIAAVNHDIQTPLHYIGFSLKQFNAYVHRQPSVDPLITRLSDETLDTSERLNTLTRNILEYIKLQSKSPSDRWEIHPVNVAELVVSTSRLFAGIAAHREVAITTDIDPAFTVSSDPSLLSIIIHNLIDNALKVARSEIKITAGENGGRKMTIQDDGGGIPAEQAYWLNKQYYSYDQWLHSSRNPGQKGIGLVIVKDLCVLLGIQISAAVTSGNKTMIVLLFKDSRNSQ